MTSSSPADKAWGVADSQENNPILLPIFVWLLTKTPTLKIFYTIVFLGKHTEALNPRYITVCFLATSFKKLPFLPQHTWN